MKNAGLAFHGWWAAFPPLWPDTTGGVCCPAEAGGGLLPGEACHPRGQLSPAVALGWQRVRLHPGVCWKECSGRWSGFTDVSGVRGGIFSYK